MVPLEEIDKQRNINSCNPEALQIIAYTDCDKDIRSMQYKLTPKVMVYRKIVKVIV